MIDVREERWRDCRDELAALFPLHHTEIADPEDWQRMPLDVNWAAYNGADHDGKLLLVTARKKQDLVGYTMSLIYPHPHYSLLFCLMDVYWLHPDHREPHGDSLETLASTGAVLLIETEEAARRRGAKKMVVQTKLWQDNQNLFDLLGFTAVERISTKWIGG
jgi:hypothetical protein